MRDESDARGPHAHTSRAFYATTQALSRELGDVAWAAYRLGDDAQRTVVDLAFDLAEGAVNDVLARLSDWTAEAGETATTLTGRLDLAWQQGRNNFEVYGLVKDVRTRLQLDWTRPFDLNRLVGRAYELGAYADLWAVEGLGHDYTVMCLDGPGVVSGLLRDGQAASLPARSLTMMHAGLGLALAERAVVPLTPYSSPMAVRGTVRAFLDACDAHSQPGYAGAAYESLGLVTRTWHPQLVDAIDEALCALDTGIAAFFWHGIGRALYFLPAYIVPGLLSPWRAVEREAPHALARRNLYAGLTWATTLVNIRQPDILANLLSVRGEALARVRGFANGISSALVMAIDTTLNDPYVLAFANYTPNHSDPTVRRLWHDVVRPAAEAAVHRYQPVLASRRRLELVFRYDDLELVTSQLDAGEPVPPARRTGPNRHESRPLMSGGEYPGLYPSSAAPAGVEERRP